MTESLQVLLAGLERLGEAKGHGATERSRRKPPSATGEQRREPQSARNVVEIVAEAAGPAGQARRFAVEMVEEAGEHEQPGGPVGRRRAANREQRARAEREQ